MSKPNRTTKLDEDLSAAPRETLCSELRAAARREEVEALTKMRDMDLADPEIRSRAWRQPLDLDPGGLEEPSPTRPSRS